MTLVLVAFYYLSSGARAQSNLTTSLTRSSHPRVPNITSETQGRYQAMSSPMLLPGGSVSIDMRQFPEARWLPYGGTLCLHNFCREDPRDLPSTTPVGRLRQRQLRGNCSNKNDTWNPGWGASPEEACAWFLRKLMAEMGGIDRQIRKRCRTDPWAKKQCGGTCCAFMSTNKQQLDKEEGQAITEEQKQQQGQTIPKRVIDRIPGDAIVLYFALHYYNFMFETVLQIQTFFFHRVFERYPDAMILCYPGRPSENKLAFLRALKIKFPMRNMRVMRQDTVYQVDRQSTMVVARHNDWFSRDPLAMKYNFWLLDNMRAALDVPEAPHFELFISRKGLRRAIAREDELFAALRLILPNLRRIQLAVFSVAEQAELFAKAKLIISPHGGCLTNALFSNREKAVVIEISPKPIKGLHPSFRIELRIERHHVLKVQQHPCKPVAACDDQFPGDLLDLNVTDTTRAIASILRGKHPKQADIAIPRENQPMGIGYAPHLDRPISFITIRDPMFDTNLGTSSLFTNRSALPHEWMLLANPKNVGISALYSEAQATAKYDLLVFLHSDVFLPEDWYRSFMQKMDSIEAIDPAWGVLGVAGVPLTWSPSSGGPKIATDIADIWAPFGYNSGIDNLPVQSLDEQLLVLRRGTSPAFDAQLPGFDLYGTDIVLSARSVGKQAYLLKIASRHKKADVDGQPYNIYGAMKKWASPSYHQRVLKTQQYVQQKWCNSAFLPAYGTTYPVPAC